MVIPRHPLRTGISDRHECLRWHTSIYTYLLRLTFLPCHYRMILFSICGSRLENVCNRLTIYSCRRWSHQTAIVDGRLYIDGGQAAYKNLAYNYTSTWQPTVVHIFTRDAHCQPKMSFSFSAISSPAPTWASQGNMQTFRNPRAYPVCLEHIYGPMK
jgi:hypothetical protein